MNCTEITNVRHRHFLIAAIYLCSLAVAGCATTIPDTDTTPPEIRLEITGPGIGRQVMTNPPRDHWTAPDGTQLFNLLPEATYRVLLTVSDRGGVARVYFRMPSDFVVSNFPSGAVEEVVGLARSVTVFGSRANPRTALVLAGRFITPGTEAWNLIGFDFQAQGDDFGGASGAPNRRFMTIDAAISDLPE